VSGRQRGTRHLHSNVRLLSTFRRCKKSCAPELAWSRLSQKSYSAGTSVYRTLVEMLLAQARSCRYGRCRHKEGDALNAFNNVKRHLLGPRERSATMSALSHPAKQWNRIRPWTCQRHRLRVLHHVVHQPSRRPKLHTIGCAHHPGRTYIHGDGSIDHRRQGEGAWGEEITASIDSASRMIDDRSEIFYFAEAYFRQCHGQFQGRDFPLRAA
jgi:hypothetical protein